MFPDDVRHWAADVLQRCESKYTRVAEEHPDGIPYTTGPDGRYDDRADRTVARAPDDGISWWTNGFWGGILWHLHASTGDQRFAEIAARSEQLLDRGLEEFTGLHHDVGFMWLPTSVASYRLTGNPDSRRRALHAANLLAGRFNPAGRFLRAWNDLEGRDTRGWTIIDSMLNIPLLHWATEETGDPRFGQIALAHADTVRRAFIREDGTSEHIVEFDPVTGGRVRAYGGQGYADGSAWTRGQAWAFYGFAVSYAQTGEAEHLRTARRVADRFVSRIPADGLIPIDFDQPAAPDAPFWEDACGAAVAACGLLELAQHVEAADRLGADAYLDAALRILRALDAHCSDYGADCDAILQHCSAAYHAAGARHITMVYADYFYIEALSKIARSETSAFVW